MASNYKSTRTQDTLASPTLLMSVSINVFPVKISLCVSDMENLHQVRQGFEKMDKVEGVV